MPTGAKKPGDGPLGVVNGISNSAQDAVEAAVDAIIQHGYRRVTPTVLTRAFPHSTASEAGRLAKFQDHVMTISTGCTSGMNSIAYAMEQIDCGKCTSMICISTDATIANYVFGSFCRTGMLSTSQRHPVEVSRPFDANRDGGVLGEGAAAFVIEEYNSARTRGAKVHAELVGYASSGAGYMIDDGGAAIKNGMIGSMRNALASSNLGHDKIDYIGCHGVSDPHLDAWETDAVKSVFGEYAYRIPMSSVKGHIGIPQNAAGHLQAIATVKAINEGLIPPTLNYETPDPVCDLDYVPGEPRRNRIRHAMVFAHGFNGSDASLIIKRYEPQHI